MKKIYIILIIAFLCLNSGCSKKNINIERKNETLLYMIESWNIINGTDQSQYGNENFNKTNNTINNWKLIESDWMVYRNDEYWFQIKFWKERSGGKIYDSFREYNIDNYNTDYDGWIKNPYIVFSAPSPRRTWTFEDIAGIRVYTYEEYEQARQNQMNPECMMCSLEEFDKAIVWKNNKYYFLLGRWNNSDDAYKTMFPSLECREETDSSVYWTYTYIYCDWIEYINWEPKKTWKDWIEQILPTESFSFFDV